MAISQKQNGMSAIGWVLFIGLIAAVSIPGMKIIPIYLNDMKIHNALNKLESDLASQVSFTTPEKIKSDLLTRFALQQMPEITPDEIMITQADDKYTVRITHQYRERIIQDKYFTLNVDKSVDITSIVMKDR